MALCVAGRTDAGVHAWGQVASFEHAGDLPDGLARRVNAVAPDDLAVIAAEPAPDGFDARRDARSREYCYRVLASPVRSPFEQGRALWWPHPVEVEMLQRCATALLGTHDFSAFTPTDTEHVRFDRDILRAEWVREPLTRSATGVGRVPSRISSQGDQPPSGAGEILEFWIEADAFMRHMVRVLVGTMLEVAGGKRSHENFAALLESAPRKAAGETAPPHGLYLARVSY